MALISLSSCEDIIDVDLNTMAPKLVIEASINSLKSSSGNVQTIKLSLSAPYFDDQVPPASGAMVFITDEDDKRYKFIETDDPGIYRNISFKPIINRTYTLTVIYNDETYEGTESLKSVVDIDYVSQNTNAGVIDKNAEIKAYYTDPEDEINFYLFEFMSKVSATPSLEVYEDRYTNGNQIFGYYSEKDLRVGDKVLIRNYGISESFYNYMFILLQQSSDANGGPFDTQPASVKGNCVNITNPENFPLGYFRLSQVSEVTYTIQ